MPENETRRLITLKLTYRSRLEDAQGMEEHSSPQLTKYANRMHFENFISLLIQTKHGIYNAVGNVTPGWILEDIRERP